MPDNKKIKIQLLIYTYKDELKQEENAVFVDPYRDFTVKGDYNEVGALGTGWQALIIYDFDWIIGTVGQIKYLGYGPKLKLADKTVFHSKNNGKICKILTTKQFSNVILIHLQIHNTYHNPHPPRSPRQSLPK